MTHEQPKTAADLIPETLAQVLTLPRKAEPLRIFSNEKPIKQPLRTKWQQKWIRLEVVHPSLQVLSDKAEAFCARWFNNDTQKSLLVIVGNFGSGKTHVAKAIFKFCLAAAMPSFETRKWPGGQFPQSLYLSWPKVANELSERNFSIMSDALENSLVVIDDIGAENDPWKICADRLCQILSRRERMFTVVTTNIQPDQWAERFDGRIADRLLRNSIVVDLEGVPSYAMNT